MNNNLWIDKTNKTKIPNIFGFFIIEKSHDWNSCIDIIVDKKENNIFNLYLILKSYASNILYPSTEFLVRIKNSNELIITEKINIHKITKNSLLEFRKWFFYRISYDSRYFNDESVYCFSFTINNKVFNIENTNYIKPIYPWKNEILELLEEIDEKEIAQKIILKNIKKELFITKIKLKQLRNKYIKHRKLPRL